MYPQIKKLPILKIGLMNINSHTYLCNDHTKQNIEHSIRLPRVAPQ